MARQKGTDSSLPVGIRPEIRDSVYEGHLGAIGSRPPMASYLRDIWSRRHFMWMDARSRVATQNSQYKLGMRWLVLQPLLDAMFYFLVFGVVLQVDRGVDNFIAFIVIGVLLFRYTQRSLTTGASLIQSNSAVVKAFVFPKASLVFAYLLREMLAMIPVFAVVVTIIVAVPPHEFPQWSWLGVIPLFVVQTVLNLGVVFVTAAVGFVWPDFRQFLGVFSRILMYASGVIFPIERFLDNPRVLVFIEANPLYRLITAYRGLLMDGVWPSISTWLTLGTWAIGLLVIGFIVFWWNEARYVRV